MFLSKKHLSRRKVLQGVGAVIGLPLLDAMIPAATALENTAAKPLPRMGFTYIPHGAVEDRWRPAQVGTEFDLPLILKPFEPVRQHMTVVSGLRNAAGESSAPHAIMPGTWLNCTKPGTGKKPKAGVSVDQIAARQFGQDTPFPSLELCTEPGGPCDPAFGCGYGGTISFRTPTQPLPMEFNPRKVFYQLFGQGDSAQEREIIVDETRSILDSIAQEAASLQRQLGVQDRVMVDDYLESIREIERRINKMEERDVSSLDLPDAPIGVPNDFEEHLNLMFDLIALAYQANLTRVTTFMMAKEVSMRTFNNVGVPDAFHPLSHHGNNRANMDKLATVQAFHTKVYSRFIDKLANIPDGDGSLLDHSILLYGSNMSNSNEHNNDPLPLLVFGHGYGKIKGGKHVAYPQDTPLANLLVTLAQRGDIKLDSLGNSNGTLADV